MDIFHLTEKNEDEVAEKIGSLLRRGGVAVVPTDTVYGLIGDCLRESAVRKIFRIKAREHHKAMPVFVRDVETAARFAYIERELTGLLSEIWPGQTTVVLRKRETMPDFVTGGMKTVALRIPDHPLVREVLELFPNPLVGTSANLSGSEAAQSATEVQKTFAKHIPRPELVVDGGRLPPSPPSTILDLTNPQNPKILRMGAITKEKLDEYLKHWQRR